MIYRRSPCHLHSQSFVREGLYPSCLLLLLPLAIRECGGVNELPPPVRACDSFSALSSPRTSDIRR